MADAVHAILEFLHRHDFSVAENALRSELTAREKGNLSLPVAVDDDFDICVNNCLTTLQEKHSAEKETLSSEPIVPLSSPGRLQVPEPGFSFTRGRPQLPFSLPEKPGIVDSSSARVESPNSSSSPRLSKSAFLSTMAPGSNQQDGFSVELSSRKDGPMSVAKSDELAFERAMQDGGAMLNFQLVENDVAGRHLWNAQDVSFEETNLVGSQQTDKVPADQSGSPHWIGIVDPNESGLQLPVVAGSPWMTTSTDSNNWGSRHDILEGGQDGFAGNYGEKPVLHHDLTSNEKAPDWQCIAGDCNRVPCRTSGELHLLGSSKEHGAVENRGPKAWKDVPLKTGLPLPPTNLFTAVPLVVEPFPLDESVMIPPEDRASQERMRTSGRSSRERAGSADDGFKVLESVSRNFREAQEELPRLPPVRLRSGDSKTAETSKDSHLGSNAKRLPESGVFVNPGASTDSAFGLGSFLDIPVGQDVSSSGNRRLSGGSRPSVSQGIVEHASERLTGFAPADGQSDSLAEYPDEFWDSDTYDDDDDPGYHRQPIEDEEWFLAHEIDYPDERSSPGLESSRSQHDKDYGKLEDDDHSVLEEESYFSGEEYYRMKRGERREAQNEIERLAASDLCSRVEGSQNGASNRQAASQLHETTDFDGQSLDVDDMGMMRGQPVWQGFTAQESGLVKGCDKAMNERAGEDGSVRSGGVGISSEVAECGSEVRGSIVGGSSEGDIDILKDRELGGYGSAHSKDIRKSVSPVEGSQEVGKDVHHVRNRDEQEVDHEMILRYYNETWSQSRANVERQISEGLFEQGKGGGVGSNGNADIHFPQEQELGGFGFGGFSFPSPSSAGDIAVMSRADSGKSLWSVRDVVTLPRGDEGDDYSNGIVGPDDTLAVWKRKSNESSPIISPRNETLRNLTLSTDSTISARSTDGYGSGEVKDGEDDEVERSGNNEEADAVAADDEEAAAVQEQIRRIRAEEEEFETFNLKIVHRKNRTGFEEDKDFPVVINSVIAGRYHVTEYLGSAAFSKAIQAHDLHTGMDVCMKIIKNNKDFFDQSLDEIKLLKYINKHDPGDKYHVLRLYDYFYHREHLFIVCELLRANLYEFHKYNRESGGEVYFTMPRLQSITRQCLEALEFIHGLKLIHCDLKPENILVKSYSRCEVKVIDLGSSCFQTDHLCSYVQSRSYRAPEVILGLPYNQKIDMWSLGCILAELCSGNVLFQNESLATLMARVVGILGPIDQEMLAKGRDTHKLFTKNQMLYERNQETEQLDYLLPKKTSLSHRLPMGDQGFVEFVEYLLQINPAARPTASEALKHTWLSFPYEPISA